jgi:hypothetical protein
MKHDVEYEKAVEKVFRQAWEKVKNSAPTAIMFQAVFHEYNTKLFNKSGLSRSDVTWHGNKVVVDYIYPYSLEKIRHEFSLPEDFKLN